MTDEMKNFCTLETCRRDFLCQHFGSPCGMSVFEFKHECCDNCQKLCKCEDCTDKLILACDETDLSNINKNKLSPSIKEQLEMVLLEYFNAENEIIAMPNSELITGLSDSFAKEICQEHILYSDKEQILCRHTTLSPHVVENIVLIVSELCLK